MFLAGIDEAGYGPNLGPFVMSLAWLKLPAELADADPWDTLRAGVRRAGGGHDGRLIVDDSKAVHAAGHGPARLARQMLPWLRPIPSTLEELWAAWVLTPWAEFQRECWFDTSLAKLPEAGGAAGLEELLRARGIGGVGLAAVVVFPRLFNRLVRQHDSKAAAVTWALGHLLDALPDDAEEGRLALDKLGGRDRYGPLLRELCFGTRVDTLEESEAGSGYRLHRGGGWRVRVEAKADQRHFPVALASMFSKLLRELLMEQFNRWWCGRQPGLAPTAGYPVDARRWWAETAGLRRELGLADAELWRER